MLVGMANHFEPQVDLANAEVAAATLDAAADNYVHEIARLSPLSATAWGIAGFDDQLDTFAPDYHERITEATRAMHRAAAEVHAAYPDNVTAAVMVDRLGVELALADAGENERALNNLASPLQTVRDGLMQMPQETEEDQANVAARIAKVPEALAGMRESLALAASRGQVAAARQVREVARQADQLASKDSPFELLPVSEEQLKPVHQAAEEFSRWLLEELLPQAPEADGVGRERYELFSQNFVGDRVDLDEAYEWGQEYLAEIIAQQRGIAQELYGTDDVSLAMRKLDEEERYTIHGVDNLREWMQRIGDQTITDMAGTHFDIPEEIQVIEACIDPAGSGGIFYTPPTADFSRPGRMWWSVPKGQDTFHTWQELTTVFHEGVPGHHLQLGVAMTEQDNLNLWRRAVCWNSGHGEGWALYAEGLMEELGYHEDPGTRMGLLDGQRLRATRVVLDIGVHLGKTNPDGGEWNYDYARDFLAKNVAMASENRDFELMRYLGWPGQAPSYALGQRLWQQLRAKAVGGGMELKEFHNRALRHGSIPMNILAEHL